ncbi:protein adenylyltransferase SelO [Paraferrimonas haliotis]|uniref:protein adenylyltransferase SelO n=1 Tax=Paraferrimonas haliotis TaxID=2013866 RepID=UPI001C52BBE4|nr:YdiU family protein [Paraferrimonas haliotis]
MLSFSQSYTKLDSAFFQRVAPTPVSAPQLLLWNQSLVEHMFDNDPFSGLSSPEKANLFSGNQLADDCEPIAQAYCGHQFGHFNPNLGDGRAHLLGTVDSQLGLMDVQLKGSGTTRYSRRGDGRCALGPALREYLMSEALAALGVPSSRCLSVVATGEAVYREQALPGAVVTRLASSHLRVGTFQFAAAHLDQAALIQLLDFAIERHYPHIQGDVEQRALQFLEAVMERQLNTVSHWMRVGFIHGVMNTDNCAISGETIDYGPCAMMGSLNMQRVFSSIDQQGRYAYANQPAITQWNMARLAETLLPILDASPELALEKAQALLAQLAKRFETAFLETFANKIGLQAATEADADLIKTLLDTMQTHELDFTNSFNQLTEFINPDRTDTKDPTATVNEALRPWLASWQKRLSLQQSLTPAEVYQFMRRQNPVMIPRNHLLEQALQSAVDEGDLQDFQTLLAAVKAPYDSKHPAHFLQATDALAEQGFQTFCGT